MLSLRSGLVLGCCALLVGCHSDRDTAAVGGVAMATVAGGSVPVEFVLVDPDSDPVDVELLFSIDDGATWSVATVTSPTTALATSPTGTRHTVDWDALADLGPRSALDVQLSVRSIETISGQAGPSVVASARLDNLSAAARRVETYMIYFGPYDAAKVAVAETHDLVILYPSDPSITRSVVADIQDGVDPLDPRDDVMVLGYVNVGEDERTIGLTDGQLLLDPRFVGDGSGPRLDPRGAGAAGGALTGLAPLGLPSVSGGYASFYLDDNSRESNGIGDGAPDRNAVTGACYVNMGDPAWFAALDAMSYAGPDGRSGLRELLTLDYGLGLGCDGVYLDNVDTCAPNSWTGPGDPDQAEFEWTAAGYAWLVEELRTKYPGALVLQNRGLFFFNPDLRHYGLTPRTNIDFLKVESYRLDSDPGQEFDPFFFADNKHNFAPKLQAEAYRSGFQVLSLGYAEGPGILHDTLLDLSTAGLATLLEDITEAQRLAGFRHYLMDGGGQIVNQFVRNHADFTDTSAPVWTSTYNVNNPGFPTPPTAPIARIGIQQAIPDVESVKVRWDVALDLNPVSYVLYYDEIAFDFGAADPFATAKTVVLQPETGFGYELGAGPAVYPYEAIITGLGKNQTYHFCIRARDTAGNEDANQVVLTARTLRQPLVMTVDGGFGDWAGVPKMLKDRQVRGSDGGPDWKEISVINDGDNLYVYFKTHDRFNLDGSPLFAQSQLRILIDVDDDPFTGFRFSNIGSELMVHGHTLVAQATGVEFVGALQVLAVNPTTDMKECELAVPLARIDAAAGRVAGAIRMIFVDASNDDRAPDSGYFPYQIVR